MNKEVFKIIEKRSNERTLLNLMTFIESADKIKVEEFSIDKHGTYVFITLEAFLNYKDMQLLHHEIEFGTETFSFNKNFFLEEFTKLFNSFHIIDTELVEMHEIVQSPASPTTYIIEEILDGRKMFQYVTNHEITEHLDKLFKEMK
jgi:hypothetical protein